MQRLAITSAKHSWLTWHIPRSTCTLLDMHPPRHAPSSTCNPHPSPSPPATQSYHGVNRGEWYSDCTTLQRSATHCKTLQHSPRRSSHRWAPSSSKSTRCRQCPVRGVTRSTLESSSSTTALCPAIHIHPYMHAYILTYMHKYALLREASDKSARIQFVSWTRAFVLTHVWTQTVVHVYSHAFYIHVFRREARQKCMHRIRVINESVVPWHVYTYKHCYIYIHIYALIFIPARGPTKVHASDLCPHPMQPHRYALTHI